MIEVADILRRHGPQYRQQHRLLPSQQKVLEDLVRCRTAACGGQLYRCDHGPFHARHLVVGMRLFLRYLHYKGLIDTDLSLAVPTVARWSLSTPPKHLSAAQVRQVLRHCDRSTPLGRRN